MVSPDMTLDDFKKAWEVKHRVTMVLAAVMLAVTWASYWGGIITALVAWWFAAFALLMTGREIRNYRRAQTWETQPDDIQTDLMDILRGFFSLPGTRPLCLWIAEWMDNPDNNKNV